MGKVVCLHVQHDSASHEVAPQLKEAVQGEGGHVGLAPLVSTFLDIFLKLEPPGGGGVRKGRVKMN